MKTLPGLVFSLVISLGPLAAFSEQAAPDSGLPPRPFHLESHLARHWDLTLDQPHRPFRGVVYYAVPPDDPCQTIHSCAMYAETREGRIEATRAVESGRFHKPLLKLDIHTAEPFHVFVRVDVQFHDTSLKAGAPLQPVKPILPGFRAEYLDDGWPTAQARAWFKQWMNAHNLNRRTDEAPADFGFRVLQFIQSHFRYVIPDDIPEHKAMVEKDPVMGDWHYTIGTSTGECWRISDTYCRVMRMNGVPARLVSGNYAGDGSGHHLRSLIYLPEAGWVPIEATSAVSMPKKPTGQFFGTWGGSYLAGNRNIDFSLPGPKGEWSIGTLDGLAFGGADGKWDFPTPNFIAKAIPAAATGAAAN